MLELLKKDYPFLKKLDEEALNQIQKHLNGRQFK
ncbi:Crp/Fnr family transcriptional regulator, partial [Turicibacter sanguinis]|nr:Crp/Fnr family transcriptional regulator [Turicibacter sanguinis]